jgi:hypothetical protein
VEKSLRKGYNIGKKAIHYCAYIIRFNVYLLNGGEKWQ